MRKPEPDSPLVVVKVGGSLLGTPRLRSLLSSLAGCRGRCLVIVPGGGPFADAVRTAQARAGFDDRLAHRLALDAMSHTAEVLAALEPRLVVARDRNSIAAAHRQGRAVLWDPVAIRAGHPAIPETWSVTSDSLALWLAAELGASRLVLLKSVDPPPWSDPERLAALGIVDEAFPLFAHRFQGDILVHGPGAGDDLAGTLAIPDQAVA